MQKAKRSVLFLIISFFLCSSSLFLLGSGGQGVAAAGPFDPDSQVGVNEVGKEAYGQSGDPKDPRTIVADVIKIVLQFLAIIFLILMIWSGFEWMTAGGNEDKVAQSKKRLKNSAIGLAIILMAYGVTYFVIEQVIDAARQPWEW